MVFRGIYLMPLIYYESRKQTGNNEFVKPVLKISIICFNWMLDGRQTFQIDKKWLKSLVLYKYDAINTNNS